MLINLDEQEQIIIDIVKEYLKSNRCFKFKKILPFIKSRFKRSSININNQGIELLLKSLLKKKIFVEGSKLNRDEVFLVPKRKRIYDYIVKNSGAYHQQIMDDLKIRSHVVVWHLKILLKFNFIKEAEINNCKIYFDLNLDLEKIKRNYYLKNKKSRKIIEYLKINNQGITQTSLSANLGMHPSTIRKYINYIELYGLIYKKILPNKILYFISET